MNTNPTTNILLKNEKMLVGFIKKKIQAIIPLMCKEIETFSIVYWRNPPPENLIKKFELNGIDSIFAYLKINCRFFKQIGFEYKPSDTEILSLENIYKLSVIRTYFKFVQYYANKFYNLIYYFTPSGEYNNAVDIIKINIKIVVDLFDDINNIFNHLDKLV
jgi:hypothetical protein